MSFCPELNKLDMEIVVLRAQVADLLGQSTFHTREECAWRKLFEEQRDGIAATTRKEAK